MIESKIGEATLAINANVLEAVRTRRSAGESLGKLAREVGLSWQRLWTLMYTAPPEQLRREVDLIEKEMHQVV